VSLHQATATALSKRRPKNTCMAGATQPGNGLAGSGHDIAA